MSHRQKLLTTLREEFNRWEELLASMPEDQITAPDLASNWSIKDVVAHLRAWQQVSIARVEAALLNNIPQLPTWLEGLDPESEDHLEEFNARIYAACSGQSWSVVYRAWREGFLRFLEIGEAIPEEQMLDPERHPWLKGYPLSAVLEGSYEHHHEHFEALHG